MHDEYTNFINSLNLKNFDIQLISIHSIIELLLIYCAVNHVLLIIDETLLPFLFSIPIAPIDIASIHITSITKLQNKVLSIIYTNLLKQPFDKSQTDTRSHITHICVEALSPTSSRILMNAVIMNNLHNNINKNIKLDNEINNNLEQLIMFLCCLADGSPRIVVYIGQSINLTDHWIIECK